VRHAVKWRGGVAWIDISKENQGRPLCRLSVGPSSLARSAAATPMDRDPLVTCLFLVTGDVLLDER